MGNVKTDLSTSVLLSLMTLLLIGAAFINDSQFVVPAFMFGAASAFSWTTYAYDRNKEKQHVG